MIRLQKTLAAFTGPLGQFWTSISNSRPSARRFCAPLFCAAQYRCLGTIAIWLITPFALIANAQTSAPADKDPFSIVSSVLEPSNLERFSHPVVGTPKDTLNQTRASRLKVISSAQRAANRKLSAKRQKAHGLKNRTKLADRNRSISPQQADRLIERFTKKFGEATSVRGGNHVWEVANPLAHHHKKQSKTISIIVHKSLSGSSQITIDRERGEDGTASWAVPRRQKPKSKKIKGKHYEKFPPLKKSNHFRKHHFLKSAQTKQTTITNLAAAQGQTSLD